MSDCPLCEQKMKDLLKSREYAISEGKKEYKGQQGFYIVLTINKTGWQHRAESDPTSHFPEREYISLM